MENRLDLEIREKLAEHLANQISLDQFVQWFVPATWEIEESGNILASELAHEIQLRLAEFSENHWTEEELRRLLSPLIESYSVSIAFGSHAETAYFSSTTSQTHHRQIFDIVFSVASV